MDRHTHFFIFKFKIILRSFRKAETQQVAMSNFTQLKILIAKHLRVMKKRLLLTSLFLVSSLGEPTCRVHMV